ncbi:MAG: exonuclease domain-containing protein, partial [Candidatus Methylomirabilales bacterium]
AFDLETTGLHAVADRVVEIGAIKFQGDQVFQTLEVLVDPGIPIPPEATAVHGITDVMVRGAPGVAEVLPGFLRFLEGSVPVAYNAPFDMAFLGYDLARAGLPLPPNPFLDACLLTRMLFPGFPTYSLLSLAAFLGLEVHPHHRALADARACMAVFLRCLNRLGRGAPFFEDLLAVHGAPFQLGALVTGKLPPTPKLGALREAIEMGKAVRIEYRDGKGGTSVRTITPYLLMPFRGEVYVEAFCHLRQDTRRFRLDRIRHITFEREP